MKKVITTITLLSLLAVPLAASAAHKLPLRYRALFCYPTGSYWVHQLAAYPDYYAANGSYYQSQYGANTQYCPST